MSELIMSRQNEPLLPSILFIATWWALETYTPFEGYGLLLTMALWWLGYLAIRMASHAVYRLGAKAWYLMLQLAVWSGLFLYLGPVEPIRKILILWGIGLPLVFTGAIAHRLYDRFPKAHRAFDPTPRVLYCGAFLVLPGFFWWQHSDFLAGVIAATVVCTLASIPLYYGWRLAERRSGGDRDARFGAEESYRDAGMSDER
jgi:hypothetical protein